LGGTFPNQSGGTQFNQTYIGEIKLISFNFAPVGWAFCNGQLLNIMDYEPLIFLIGTTYGGDGVATFALPDLRGTVPVSPGTSPAGYNWEHGEKSN